MKPVIEVLLVDDNAGDTELVSELLRQNHRSVHVEFVSDGVEAMAFLRREGKHSGALRPHLVMLDLTMPRKNGWEVLNDIKSDRELRTITVLVFTTSRATNDMVRSHELGANSYASKPQNLAEYVSTVSAIGNYWFDVACMVGQERMREEEM
jgi:two-component system, chemotaxis family, response regulator Rcp1